MDGLSIHRGGITAKLFGDETPELVLAKRIRIFVLIGIVLVALNKLTLSRFSPIPNFEMIIPTLCVVGCLSLHPGGNKFWRHLTRYFVVALITVSLADLLIWGFHPIYAFTWSGFVVCWLLARREKLSIFERFKTLLRHTMLTAAIAILVFDIYTCFGWAFLAGARTLAGFAAVFLAQIPFTLYHLSSLMFVPPLVGLAKALVRVKIPVPVSVPAAVKIQTAQGK